MDGLEDVDPYDVLVSGDPEALEALAAARRNFPFDLQEPDAPDYGWLYVAIETGSVKSLSWMIARGVDFSRCNMGWDTPLHAAIDSETKQRYEVMRLLIAAGADLNPHGMHGWTPLHLAVMRDDVEAMRILLDAGADRTKRTHVDDHATPEEQARTAGHRRSADFIRDHGT